jgi:hypothetical protein
LKQGATLTITPQTLNYLGATSTFEANGYAVTIADVRFLSTFSATGVAGSETALKIEQKFGLKAAFVAQNSGNPAQEAAAFNQWRANRSVLFPSSNLSLGTYSKLIPEQQKKILPIYQTNFIKQRIDAHQVYVFSSPSNVSAFFETNDLDYEHDTIIRREILPSGKSRAFINDSPVNLQELQELGLFLIDIHSQQQTQELSEERFQFQIIDSVANNSILISNYSAALKSYKKNMSQLLELTTQLQSIKKEQDYNTFLLEELLAAKLKVGEQEELESTYEQLNNVEFLKENLRLVPLPPTNLPINPKEQNTPGL